MILIDHFVRKIAKDVLLPKICNATKRIIVSEFYNCDCKITCKFRREPGKNILYDMLEPPPKLSLISKM